MPSSCSTTKEPLCYSRVVMKLLKISWVAGESDTIDYWFEITLESWLDSYLPYKELSITRLVTNMWRKTEFYKNRNLFLRFHILESWDPNSDSWIHQQHLVDLSCMVPSVQRYSEPITISHLKLKIILRIILTHLPLNGNCIDCINNWDC